ACFKRGGVDEAFALLDRMLAMKTGAGVAREPRLTTRWTPATLSRLGHSNGNGNGNGHVADELWIRATLVAREELARNPAARRSGSGPASRGDRRRGRRARRPGGRSAG